MYKSFFIDQTQFEIILRVLPSSASDVAILEAAKLALHNGTWRDDT
jgi:hypothetical protein